MQIEDQLGRATTRRTIVKTGVKVAYAAPLVLGSLQLAGAGVRAGGLGDNTICGDPESYLGRIEVPGEDNDIGDTFTSGQFTIEVTAVKEDGGIIGFTVTGGSYGYIVVHAGNGGVTYESEGPDFDVPPTAGKKPKINALSFVAFCISR